MGKPDLFAKRTFASTTESITGGAVSWEDAPEIGLERVQSDGILVIHDPKPLRELAAPWNLITDVDEILMELKMQGDHVDRLAIGRTLLRRQAREVQRLDVAQRKQKPWLGSQTLWLVSAYLPDWVKQRRPPSKLAAGCYQWANEHFSALWIASNELPLRDELIPFLITRTGRALEDFVYWIGEKRSWSLLEDLLRSLQMLAPELRNFLENYAANKFPYADRDTKRNFAALVGTFFKEDPDFIEELSRMALQKVIEAAVVLREARSAVKGILQARKLDVRPDHLALIDECTNLDTLHRWRDRAVTAASVDEALAVD